MSDDVLHKLILDRLEILDAEIRELKEKIIARDASQDMAAKIGLWALTGTGVLGLVGGWLLHQFPVLATWFQDGGKH